MKHVDRVIGKAVERRVREAIRHEEMLARWRPVCKRAEFLLTWAGIVFGCLLVWMMVWRVAAAALAHRGMA